MTCNRSSEKGKNIVSQTKLLYALHSIVCKLFIAWHQFDVSFPYNQGRKNSGIIIAPSASEHMVRGRDGISTWLITRQYHGFIQLHYSSALRPVTRAQLLSISFLHLSFFSFSPTFSVLFILLAKQTPADWSSPVRVYVGWDWLGGKKKINK